MIPDMIELWVASGEAFAGVRGVWACVDLHHVPS